MTIESLVGELSNAGVGKRLKRFGWAAAFIALFAAGFMIHAAIAGATAQRRKDLATLRCIGASRGQIMAAVVYGKPYSFRQSPYQLGYFLAGFLICLGLISGNYFAHFPHPP